MSNARAGSARVVHHVPGRLRIRVESAWDGPDHLEEVRGVLVRLPGIEEVRVSVASSSIVIGYSPADPGFAEWLAAEDSLTPWLRFDMPDEPDETDESAPPAMGPDSHVAEAVFSTASKLDAAVRRASDGYVDLKVLVPMAIGAASGISARRGRGTPMWLTLAMFAFNAFTSLHRARLESGEVPERAHADVGLSRRP